VSGEIAGALCPFDGGLAIGLAIRPGRVLHDSVTSLAGLDDRIASPAIVGAAVLLHKDALCSRLNRLANHDNLPPFFRLFLFNLVEMITFSAFFQPLQKKRVTRKSNSFW
jgi:hypothetical protein